MTNRDQSTETLNLRPFAPLSVDPTRLLPITKRRAARDIPIGKGKQGFNRTSSRGGFYR